MDLSATRQGQPTKVSIELLDPEHYRIFVQAIQNVLLTELAELTMAQLVDGLPLAASGLNAQGSLIIRGHPLLDHERLCDGVMDQTRTFRDAFDPGVLRFESPVMQAYQNARVGSRQFRLRLAELVAVSIHQIAVLLFQLEPKLHNGDIGSVVSWKRKQGWITLETGRRIREDPPLEPRPTLFFHVDYMAFDQYPNGLADVAGYWAEDRIFGGVVLFDRGDSGYECEDIYFHSGRKRTTFRVWRLLDAQFDALSDFLLSSGPSPPSPFPILASDENLHRHDPWEAIALHHIFRDPWERKVTPTKPPETRDVRSTGDYPELEAMFTQMNEIDHANRNTFAHQETLPINSELLAQTGEPCESGFTEEERTEQLQDQTEVDETNSLYARTPPRSPSVHSPDVSSLLVKTPQESPVLSPIESDPGHPSALPADTDSTSRFANQIGAAVPDDLKATTSDTSRRWCRLA